MRVFTRCCLWLSVCWLAIVLAAWSFSRLTAPASGSMENLYARVRVGMSLQQAVAALQAGERDYVECIYVSGTDSRGRPFFTFYSLKSMPPAAEIHDCELAVTCNTGESVEVTLGEGGVVTAKKYLPDPDRPHQYWLHRLHRVFGH
jgi:hypothetical protein